MKKILSLVLVSVMLLATVFMCKVDANAAEVEKKPFYLSNWDEAYTEDNPYIWQKAYFWATREGTEVTVSFDGAHDIPGMAQKLKELFDTYPDGAKMRIMNITPVERRFMAEQTEDYVFMETGAKRMAEWADAFLSEYKRIGGKLDGFHSDLEYIDGYYWYLYQKQFQSGNTDVYYNITQNPAYLTRLRPMLEERGFQFYPKPLDSMPEGVKRTYCELYSLHPSSGSQYNESRYIWDVCVKNMQMQYLDECLWTPAQKYFPEAYVDDYNSHDSYAWLKNVPETGSPMYIGGNYNKTGNFSNFNNYNYGPDWVKPSESDTSYKKPVSHSDAIYEDNAFNMTLWEINTVKDFLAATDTKNIVVPVTTYAYGREYGDDPEGSSSGTPFHVEGYFHLGLCNAEMGGYIIQKESPNSAEYKFRLEVVSAILEELTRVAGYADRKIIETPTNWNDAFILTGMYSGGRNIWRITPDTVTGVSKKEFLVKNDGEIVFKNKGQTITFPQGTIIEDGFIPEVGTCGYWVETPADVSPIVTNDANRYTKYPSYSESFDGYETGITFDQKANRYSHTWEAWIRDNSSATIEVSKDNAKNKVLALSGNVFAGTVKIPTYIIAGDTYAKQQAWQISFSLDSLPSGNAEAKLLNASSGTGVNTDGGFRIYDGKLYYGPTDNYVAFENVTLAANTQYTVKRVLDMQTEGAFTCSYYVYDASGNLLDQAENVAMATLKLPVEKIELSVSEFGSNKLYLDNYKISVAGLQADFSLYNANTGMEVEDAAAAQKTDTAYRLSWLNASDATKTYNIVATFSDGTKEILKRVVMRPGCDAVETGIVKVADGKSVTITAEVTETSDSDISGDPSQGGSGTNQGGQTGAAEEGPVSVLLIIIAVLLFLILVGVFFLCLMITGTPRQQNFFKKQAPKAKPLSEATETENDPE